jgi:L-ribulose-5-phosphate 3-epimerase
MSGRSGLLSRRGLCALPLAGAGLRRAPAASRAGDLPLGIVAELDAGPEAAMRRVHELGLPTCFVYTDDFAPELAARLKDATGKNGIEITGLESLGPGKNVWNFAEGPSTIGLVPRATRRARVDSLKRASDFAKRLGIPNLQTHCGFIPETPSDPLYGETVQAVREVAQHAKGNGQAFLFETGQETPITLVRIIRDVGLDNVGVGLDTANLILYGKANPLDALDVLGKYVRTVHAKDGLYPTDPNEFGQEVPIGKGKVDFPRVIQRLRALGYHGAITIENEMSGDRQMEQIRQSIAYLQKIIGNAA